MYHHTQLYKYSLNTYWITNQSLFLPGFLVLCRIQQSPRLGWFSDYLKSLGHNISFWWEMSHWKHDFLLSIFLLLEHKNDHSMSPVGKPIVQSVYNVKLTLTVTPAFLYLLAHHKRRGGVRIILETVISEHGGGWCGWNLCSRSPDHTSQTGPTRRDWEGNTVSVHMLIFFSNAQFL